MHVEKNITKRKVRAFSIASSVDEEFLKIGTKIIEDPSVFKCILRDFKSGDFLTIDGPMGNFTLEENLPAIFIAGGIGITPIRSILMHIHDKGFKFPMKLIYSEPRKIYPFVEEFKNIDGLEILLANTKESTQLLIQDNISSEAFFYVSGSPSFITGVKEQLEKLGIQTDRIKYDRFNGY